MVNQELKKHFKKISNVIWELPSTYKEGMKVPARIYVTEELLNEMDDRVVDQITNVATLPGIQHYAYCMPDAHSGYGFPIGGVAAMDAKTGVISPGGIGFDINCGMRFVRTNLTIDEVQPKIKELVNELFKAVPAGVGQKGFIKLDKEGLKNVSTFGAKWAVDNGYGWKEDLDTIEENGYITHADFSKVSEKAIKRGIGQVGTLGSGNHYLEIQHAAKIWRPEVAQAFGIQKEGQIGVMVHCGSRGYGHQIATDYLRVFLDAMPRYGIHILDRELACAPFHSPEGQDYYQAMACAANLGFANRQVILHRIREVFSRVFGKSARELGMELVYDIAHNIAKLETYTIDDAQKEMLVHRKGATRCMGPSRPETPEKYKSVGQPVIIGGSMETGSYLLVGTDKSAQETFASTMHGSGRTMSRTQARKEVHGDKLQHEMAQKGIYVKAASMKGLAEEAGAAYKDINAVVDVMETAGVSHKVVQLKPLGNVKG
ncbi:RNA-splicing ligase RtcB [Candidatus Woesearchaeota archaeon]|nr:RNA-splicing ligase RtcB [Candidatus Woesearchaeota archaeon]